MHFLLYLLLQFAYVIFVYGEADFPENFSLPHSVNVITGAWYETVDDLVIEGPFELKLTRTFHTEERSLNVYAPEWQFNLPDVLCKEPIRRKMEDYPNRILKFDWDESGRLKEVRTLRKSDRIAVNWMRFSYPDRLSCSVEASNGQKVFYSFEENGNRIFLKNVKKNEQPPLSYTYCMHPTERKALITSVCSPEGCGLRIEYFLEAASSSDTIRGCDLGKIKSLAAGGSNQKTYFEYHPQSTAVTDVSGNKTVYHYNVFNQIQKIEDYSKDQTLYRVQKNFWKEGRISCKALLNGIEEVLSCIQYTYNDDGLLIKETVAGNLSGACQAPILLSEDGLIQNAVETYSKEYRYTDEDLPKVCFESEDNGKGQSYVYDPNNNLLLAEFLLDRGCIKSRTFYSYDLNGCLKKQISDNGISLECEDLTGVSVRTIKEILSFNDQGDPLITEERCLDLKTNRESLIQTVTNSFSSGGLLIKQDTVAADGTLLSSKQHSSNGQGCLVQVENKEGLVRSSLIDFSGNLLYEFDRASEKETFNKFDTAGRLLCSEVREQSKVLSSFFYRYDSKGNLEAQADSLGNETVFRCDERGRKIETALPLVHNEKGCAIVPSYFFQYDIYDRVIAVMDPKGYSTETDYNLRGQPTEIRHPDGTLLRYAYALDGSLREEIKSDGTRIRYERDFLGRVLNKKTFSSSMELLEEETSEYDAFHPILETSSNGFFKKYLYDAQGSLHEVEDQQGLVIQYTYGSQGEVAEEQRRWNNGSLIKTSIQKNAIRKYGSKGDLCLEFFEHPDLPESSYEAVVVNGLGQKVLEKTCVDEKGISTIFLHDALGRVIRVVQKNSFGREILQKIICYDAAGNKAYEAYQNEEKLLATLWNFGPMNRLEETIEAYGSPLQKSSEFFYNSLGQLEQIVKPDGVSVCYHYDEAGRALSLFSSDQTINYQFAYDSFGRLLNVKDLQHQCVSSRTYDTLGHVVQEHLANGLSLENIFDEQGRRCVLCLPDRSSISYVYDDFFLREVVRKDLYGAEKYRFSYLSYDLNGAILSVKLIGGLGICNYARNEKDACASIESPFHTVKAAYSLHCPNTIDTISTCDSILSHKDQFQYDCFLQLTKEEGSFQNIYSYDAFGNRFTSLEDYNDLNELLASSCGLCSYDKNGNLISETRQEGLYEYAYDALNRLTAVYVNGALAAAYLYDCFHRRLIKTTPEKQIFFIYDGYHEIGAVEDGQIKELRVLGVSEGSEAGASVALELGEKTYCPLHDLRGSILGIINIETMQIEERYSFSAFGEERILLSEEGKPKNPWRFSGKRIDQESGFIFFGRRFYSCKSGRWITPDPCGYIDGPNLYSFVQNNPVMKKDHFGLVVEDAYKTFYKNVFTKIFRSFVSFFKTVKRISSLEYYDNLAGKGYLYFMGYYLGKRTCGVYGKGEINNAIRITMINGMLTNEYWLNVALKDLSESHGGVNIHYVHRPPTNFFLDLLRAVLVRRGEVSPHARMLADTWKELIHEMGGTESGKTIIHYSHSIGTSETIAALNLLTASEQKMIKVYSFGSPDLSCAEGLDISHFVSVRDGICLLDPVNFVKAIRGKNPCVTFVGGFRGVPLVDHLFGTTTYKDIWESMGKTFVEWFGGLL